jgi:hypothetical protein
VTQLTWMEASVRATRRVLRCSCLLGQACSSLRWSVACTSISVSTPERSTSAGKRQATAFYGSRRDARVKNAWEALFAAGVSSSGSEP